MDKNEVILLKKVQNSKGKFINVDYTTKSGKSLEAKGVLEDCVKRMKENKETYILIIKGDDKEWCIDFRQVDGFSTAEVKGDGERRR